MLPVLILRTLPADVILPVGLRRRFGVFYTPVVGRLNEGLTPTVMEISETSYLNDTVVVLCFIMSTVELVWVMPVLLALYVPKLW